MGDRAVILFAGHHDDWAAVYLHLGGSDADTVLDGFFDAEQAAVDAGTRDNRFDDPSYLAARFVAAVTRATGRGVGIVPVGEREASNWRVHCTGRVRPVVSRLDGGR